MDSACVLSPGCCGAASGSAGSSARLPVHRRPSTSPHLAPTWMTGDLDKKSDLAPGIRDVKKVICIAVAHGWKDLEDSRRIYEEAVGELVRLRKSQRGRASTASCCFRQLIPTCVQVNPNSPAFASTKSLQDVLSCTFEFRG